MIFEKLKHRLVVSCQAETNSPFNSPDGVLMFAKAAIDGGAAGIRSEGFEKTKFIVENVNVPVIGLTKSFFDDGYVKITSSFSDVEKLLSTGCHIIAVDGTFRFRENINGPQFIQEIKKKFDCIIMADVSTYSEGIACADYGADCISSTLSGYTPDTQYYPKDIPDFNIIQKLCNEIKIPVFAEGRINNPKYAASMISYGAWAVVVGTAITRPAVITKWYVDKMKNEFQ